MLTRADIAPLSIAAATACAAGLAFGVWAAPPASLAEPSFTPQAQTILADDPNLASYKRMIAEQGGPGPLYIVTAYTTPVAAQPTEPDPGAVLEAQLAREAAAAEQQARAWDAEREAWLQARREEQQVQRPLPVAYVGAASLAPSAAPEQGRETPTAAPVEAAAAE